MFVGKRKKSGARWLHKAFGLPQMMQQATVEGDGVG